MKLLHARLIVTSIHLSVVLDVSSPCREGRGPWVATGGCLHPVEGARS
jgi:hypothetical protein